MSNNVAVIGLGNALRRDDGIGIIILGSLFNNYKRQGIDYLNFGIASFDLIHRLQDYQAVLLIDGISANMPAGKLRIFTLKEAAFSREDNVVSSHELKLKDIFRLAEDLDIKARIYVAGIQVADVGFGEFLSNPLAENLDKLTKEVDSFISNKLI